MPVRRTDDHHTGLDLDSYLEVAVTAARAAGEEILAALDRPCQVWHKGFRDIVTDADLKAERAIVETIRAHFPDHSFRTEESSAPVSAAQVRTMGGTGVQDQQAEFLWFVDPLDGTTNFAHGYPLFCTSLALRHGDETLVGVVYDPVQEHLFTARSRAGAWLSGRRLQVSVQTSEVLVENLAALDCHRCPEAQNLAFGAETLEVFRSWPERLRLQVSEHDRLGDALVGLDWARDPAVRERSVACVAALAPRVATLRALGSAVLALCSVAAGWLEGYFNLALYDWDVAAAELFIREAGGRVTDLQGEPWRPGMRGCLASNGQLHEKLLAILSKV